MTEARQSDLAAAHDAFTQLIDMLRLHGRIDTEERNALERAHLASTLTPTEPVASLDEARYFEDGCVFCAKARGNPDRVMVFEPLNPVTPGHLLVVPTAHTRDATEWPDITAYVMERAATVARSVGPCNLITSVGSEATQTVFHLHVHVVPRQEDDGLALPWVARLATDTPESK